MYNVIYLKKKKKKKKWIVQSTVHPILNTFHVNDIIIVIVLLFSDVPCDLCYLCTNGAMHVFSHTTHSSTH